MQTPTQTPAALSQDANFEANGFSLTLDCQLSSVAFAREFEVSPGQWQNSDIPESVRQTMLDQLALAAKKTLIEAHPRLLACLVAVALGHLSELNKSTIVAPVTPPLPGQHWPEQGGTYIGIASAEGDKPMHHLVVLDDKPANRLNWKDAITWADSLGNGARLPTQLEALFAWTTSPESFEDEWYWTGTQTSRDLAIAQDFEHGHSDWGNEGHEFRVRPVRGLALHTFAPLTAIAEGDSGEKNLVAAQAAA